MGQGHGCEVPIWYAIMRALAGRRSVTQTQNAIITHPNVTSTYPSDSERLNYSS
jgi:hypothetical protein